jgi:hypothetical protein
MIKVADLRWCIPWCAFVGCEAATRFFLELVLIVHNASQVRAFLFTSLSSFGSAIAVQRTVVYIEIFVGRSLFMHEVRTRLFPV